MDILEETKTLNSKIIDTSLDSNVKFLPNHGEPLLNFERYE